ncbi:MAG TPA: alpha/beta hydrolase [Terriglobales bacterium]|nr:alpha/beta hydrolase [Terriglobales bacterium]
MKKLLAFLLIFVPLTFAQQEHLPAAQSEPVAASQQEQPPSQQSAAQETHEPYFVAPPQTFPLWPDGAPGALGTADVDIPTLTLYEPLHPSVSATAVVVAPGGSYVMLAMNHEGRQVANWLNSLGVTAFVLKYRLGPKYHHPIELGDAQRAIRFVRSHAAEYGISPDRIGMMGFSAGGHLTSTVGTHFDNGDPDAGDPIDRVSCRPDFLVLAYPVISFIAPYSHSSSAKNLLGPDADLKLREELSSEMYVTAETPPTFLFTTSADKTVPAENSIAFYLALRRAGVPAEMHVFEKGPHGVGLDLSDPVLGKWPMLLANWMRQRGLLQK